MLRKTFFSGVGGIAYGQKAKNEREREYELLGKKELLKFIATLLQLCVRWRGGEKTNLPRSALLAADQSLCVLDFT